jgi:RecA-family ATPase
MLAGAAGSGKSWLALELALIASEGGYLLGSKRAGVPYVPADQAGHVLYLSLEEDRSDLLDRLDSIDDARKRDCERSDRLWLIGADEAEAAGAPTLVRYDSRTGQASVQTLFERISVVLASRAPWSLIVIDTLAQTLAGGVELEQEAATACMQQLKPWTRLPGQPAVLLIHHSRKLDLKSKAEGWLDSALSTDSARGASALAGSTRWLGMVARPSRKRDLYFEVAKANGIDTDAMPRLHMTLGERGVLQLATDPSGLVTEEDLS